MSLSLEVADLKKFQVVREYTTPDYSSYSSSSPVTTNGLVIGQGSCTIFGIDPHG